LSQGGRLNLGDLQFAQGVGALQPFVQQYGLRRDAELGGVASQIHALPVAPGMASADQRLAAAEVFAAKFGQVRLQLEQQIRIEIQLAGQTTVDAILRSLAPALRRELNNTMQGLGVAVHQSAAEQLLMQMRANGAAVVNGGR
jgi:hypothetical protein